MSIKALIDRIKRKYAKIKGGQTYLNYLRSKGVKIGNNCTIGMINTITIDYTRPYLVEIGDEVRLNTGLTIMTHDFPTMVFKNLFGEFLPSSGKVKIYTIHYRYVSRGKVNQKCWNNQLKSE